MRVTGREMHVLKSLCRFKMCADVKDSLVVKSFTFVNSCIQKVNLFIRYFSRKFNLRVMPVYKGNEFTSLLSLSSPQWENIVNVSFSPKGFSFVEVQYFCLCRWRKDVGKGDCHLCSLCSSVCLEILPLNSNEFSGRISLRIRLRDWDCVYSLFLWDSCILASNV